MEIRNVLRGENISFAASRPAPKGSAEVASAHPAADRVELSRQWLEVMEEQRERIQNALRDTGKKKDEDEGGILAYMETEEDKLDALSEELEVQQKCLKIAMNIMKGKKVPPEDERYLMEHDPNGYKIAIAMKTMVKEDKEECESVLDDEDRNGSSEGESSGEAAPAETSSGGGEAE